MLGPKGRPSATNLASIPTALQKTEGVHFELALKRLVAVNPRHVRKLRKPAESRLAARIGCPTYGL